MLVTYNHTTYSHKWSCDLTVGVSALDCPGDQIILAPRPKEQLLSGKIFPCEEIKSAREEDKAPMSILSFCLDVTYILSCLIKPK